MAFCGLGEQLLLQPMLAMISDAFDNKNGYITNHDFYGKIYQKNWKG